MILLEDYDPALRNCWWLEGTRISSNIYLIDDGRVMIDTGNFQGMVKEIDEELDPSKIEKVILTHSHFDHVGGLIELLDYANPEILLHRDGMPLVHFNQYSFVKLMEMSGRGEKLVSLRGGERIAAGSFDLEVIHIPGHTLDHIALYEHGSGSLFTGDTVFPATAENNTLSAPDPKLGNIDQMIYSLKRLLRYDVKNLFPGHGFPVFESGGEHIKNSLFQTIKDVDKMEDKAWVELGQSLAECGRHREAVECYDVLLREFPSHMEARLQKGLALLEMSCFEEALAALEMVLKPAPHQTDALVGKGFALMGLGRTEEALLIEPFREQLLKMRGGH
jgi:hydroxyacylglutathione hydrolase